MQRLATQNFTYLPFATLHSPLNELQKIKSETLLVSASVQRNCFWSFWGPWPTLTSAWCRLHGIGVSLTVAFFALKDSTLRAVVAASAHTQDNKLCSLQPAVLPAFTYLHRCTAERALQDMLLVFAIAFCCYCWGRRPGRTMTLAVCMYVMFRFSNWVCIRFEFYTMK